MLANTNQRAVGGFNRGLFLVSVALEMFGGKYDAAKLRFPINLLAGKEPASDLRDWTAIRA